MLSVPSEGESLAAVERRLSLAIEQEYRLAYLGEVFNLDYYAH